ncbi:LRP chaperone MESD isoform X2 [Siphateles boraxobius]|uniref:LRP chaperone MESD isoform X2 n=1 Tax=Siphateles boraxobius TaxID=180520 RepID=UPI004063245B
MATPVSSRTVSVLLFLIFFISVHCTETKAKKKKDIRDYNDADMARLLEEWEMMTSKRVIYRSTKGNPTEKETEEITSLWQGSLFNANFDVQRFVVGSNRVIFMLRDGSYAWEIKDFLVAQDRCEDVTVEGQVFPGKDAKKDAKGNEQNDTKKKGDKKAANRANKSKQEL